MPPSAKTVKQWPVNMAGVTGQQIKTSIQRQLTAWDESWDVIDIEQAALLCTYVNSRHGSHVVHHSLQVALQEKYTFNHEGSCVGSNLVISIG